MGYRRVVLFLPYYEDTTMEGDTDINAAYDIRNKIHDYMIYNYDDVDVFNKFMVSNVGKNQDAAALGRLAGMFRPVIQRYKDLSVFIHMLHSWCVCTILSCFMNISTQRIL